MRVKYGLGCLILGAFWMGWQPTDTVGAPWDKLFSSVHVDADPQKPYALSEENGPWMIMTCSFRGEKAKEQAHNLVIELRKRYKLPAYAYEKTFDLGKDTYGRGVDKYGNPRKMKYQSGRTEIEEIAVLVGNYQAVDDPNAQEILRQLKVYQPECLKTVGESSSSQTYAGWRKIQREAAQHLFQSDEESCGKRGPMGHAFVTTNPILPPDYFVPKGLDSVVVKANQGVEYSLLDCPGKYTLQVAHFSGEVIIDPKKIAALKSGVDDKISGKLAEAAEKAHRLTEALRLKGYDAYEFHDRCASIVTVGSFESVGSPREDGKIEIAPDINVLMERFKGEVKQLPGRPAPDMVPKTLVGIPFDVQPIPVHVPKRSVVAENSRGTGTFR